MTEYSMDDARVMANVIDELNKRCSCVPESKQYSMVQQYHLQKGLKKFGEKGYAAAHKEMKQLHDRVVFKPVHIEDLTPLEKKKAMDSFMFLVQKSDEAKTVKVRTVVMVPSIASIMTSQIIQPLQLPLSLY